MFLLSDPHRTPPRSISHPTQQPAIPKEKAEADYIAGSPAISALPPTRPETRLSAHRSLSIPALPPSQSPLLRPAILLRQRLRISAEQNLEPPCNRLRLLSVFFHPPFSKI
jgi:hypothetical protein